jgi:hypothetical protein
MQRQETANSQEQDLPVQSLGFEKCLGPMLLPKTQLTGLRQEIESCDS